MSMLRMRSRFGRGLVMTLAVVLALAGIAGMLGSTTASAATPTDETATHSWPSYPTASAATDFSAAAIKDYLASKGITGPTTIPAVPQAVHTAAVTTIPVDSCPADAAAMQDLLNQAASASPSTLQFNVAGCKVTLSPATGALEVFGGEDYAVTIDGNGLIIDGGGTAENPDPNAVMRLTGTYGAQLTLNDVTIQNGEDGILDTSDVPGIGAFLVALTNCTVQDNADVGVRALFVTASQSTFANNGVNGILAAAVQLDRSIVAGNGNSYYPTGGVFAGYAAAVNDSYIVDNTGGIISGFGDDPNMQISVVVTNSTIEQNEAGIASFYAVDVANSTIVTNGANIDIEGEPTATSTITATTLVDSDWNIYTESRAPLKLTADILALSGTDCDISMPIQDGGYNLADDDSCGFSGTNGSRNDVVNLIDALIPPANNGGPLVGAPGSEMVLPSAAIEPGSIPVDYIPANGASGCLDASGNPITEPVGTIDTITGYLGVNWESLTTDERGVARPQGPKCDVGSFELQNTVATLPGSTSTVHQGYWALIRVEALSPTGQNISVRTLKVTSIGLDGPDGQVISFVHQFQFGRFGGTPGYQLSINTRSLERGTWTLIVQVGSGQNAAISPVTFNVD